MRHVVMFSGGIGSWATAKRVAERHGTDDLVLLFADTLVEDADTYRFLKDAAANVYGGDTNLDLLGRLVIVEDGRTPFEVFKTDRFLGNARLANCSKYLKQIPCREWIEEHCGPITTTLYVGIDWTEMHRLPAIEAGWAPWRVEAPLTEPPLRAKAAFMDAARREGLEPPRDYAAGFPHANCGAQGCVRGGQAYWRQLLAVRREVYLSTEQHEEKLRGELGDVSILRDRTGGESTVLTLREFRERAESGDPSLFDAAEWGGCGCFTEEVSA